ncbi:rhamnosyltransferase [Serratia fonticola]|uniref:glycosyltransferase family 2 protein n=1 Tax=Serratia fonticola TaxID=47917 RepID=UPI0021829FA0|nr:glycosyltransferase family 2 protein [Serratia fonticola]CAI2136853.1 rhamnosyltransferase [Serratia fonticola]
MPIVAGIVVTYNPEHDFFEKQIENLSKQLDLLYIVDNGSKDTSFVNFAIGKGISYHLLNENVGLASAQNVAIKLAQKDKVTHVILFDQDSLISDDFVKNELHSESQLLNRGINVAAIGPVFYDGTTDYDYPATKYIGPFIHRVKIAEKPIEATFIIASGSLIRMEVLEKVGFMKDELFIDYIDVEWGLRAASLGYKSYITPLARMKHTIGDERVKIFGKLLSIHSDIRKYYLSRNSFYMLRLGYVPFGYKLRECVFNFVRITVGIYFSKNRINCFKMVSKGILDGITNKFGPYTSK